MNSAFLADIVANPDDDTPRLIYADWCEDNGQADRAEFIRLQIDLTRLPPGDPRRGPLYQRARELLQLHEAAWVGELRGLATGGKFGRGFLEAVTVDAAAFLDHAAQLFDLAPIRTVHLRHVGPHLRRLVHCPHLERLAGLDLHSNFLGNEAVAALAGSPYLSEVQTLDLSNNDLSTPCLRSLCRSPHLTSLVRLDLGLNRFQEDTGALVGGAELPALRELSLRSNPVRDRSVVSLANSQVFGQLNGLDLSFCLLGPRATQALAESIQPTSLTSLNLTWNDLADSGLEALSHAPLLATLTELGLSHTGVGDRGTCALAVAPDTRQLVSLNLSANEIHVRGLRYLLVSAFLQRLERLDLGGNPLDAEAVRSVMAEPLPPALAALNLRDCPAASDALLPSDLAATTLGNVIRF